MCDVVTLIPDILVAAEAFPVGSSDYQSAVTCLLCIFFLAPDQHIQSFIVQLNSPSARTLMLQLLYVMEILIAGGGYPEHWFTLIMFQMKVIRRAVNLFHCCSFLTNKDSSTFKYYGS